MIIMQFNYGKWMLLAAMMAAVCSGCQMKNFGSSSSVCVCNSKTCELPGNHAIPNGKAQIYTNSRDKLRSHYTTEVIREKSSQTANSIITLKPEVQYQSIIGFGSSFTDAAGIGINKLSKPMQDQLLRAYFTEDGADYNLCRVPIAGTDFSTRPYSYDDVPGDEDLKHFALAEEDYSYKIPYIKKAMELSNQHIKLFGSPWSPPGWMKTNGKVNGEGSLIKEMYQPWANYIVKFVNAYEKELGVKLWGLTAQNQPFSGIKGSPFNSCHWTPADIRDWIALYIGPTLEAAGLRRLAFMVADLTRNVLKDYVSLILSSDNSSKYVDGISVHWYVDNEYEASILDDVYEKASGRFMLYSEACEGYQDNTVILGSWERGEHYMANIIEAMNHWQSGWVDWNLALDTKGGPNWANNAVDSPIIINHEEDEFYLQPMYFAMTHFSKFINRDARRINFTISNDMEHTLHATAFINPDETRVLIVANLGEEEMVVQLNDEEGHVLTKELQPKSWHTIRYESKPQIKVQYSNEL